MARAWFCLMTLAAAVSVSAGQTVGPALMVQQAGKSEPLKLQRVEVDSSILGHLAETKMTLTFHNPYGRPLAGDLYFPLPEGAAVSGYALDVGGKMIDGVVVEKRRAREVFEKEVRKGVDPGLVEWVKGNNFKTRVFPIPAGGERTVMVKYVSELSAGGDGSAAWRLPLNFKGKIARAGIRIQASQTPGEPKVTAGPAELSFRKSGGGYLAQADLKDAALDKDLVVLLPEIDRQKVLVEKAPDGQVYFMIRDTPKRVTLEPPPPPSSITILWDASGSRAAAARKRELELLKNYLKALTVQVNVVVFRNAAEPAKVFTVADGRADELLAFLQAVPLDGGTQMAAVSPRKPDPVPTFYLLFTDGISNIGQETPTGFEAPVYIVCSSPSANHAFLRHLAERAGGQYFNLSAATDQAAIGGIGAQAYSFLSAAVEGEADQIFPSAARRVDGALALVGKLKGRSAKVTLDFGFQGRGGMGGLYRPQYEVSAAAAADGDLLRRYWAQKKLDELMVLPKANAAEIVALGKEYSLVTPGTSLIVLETLAQYVEHKIAPPKSLPEMRNQYLALMDEQAAQETKADKGKLERVQALWQERVKWWEAEYKYPKDFKYAEPAQSQPSSAPAARMMAPALPSPRPAGGVPFVANLQPLEASDADRTEADWQGLLRYPSGRAAGGKPSSGGPAIAIKEWDPKTPYLEALKKAPADKLLEVYLAQKDKFGNSPGFYLDCADFFLKQNRREPAMQVLSNVAEMELENPALLRVLGHRLAQLEELDLAAGVFEEVLELRPEEPESYRDLALVLARRAQRRYVVLQVADMTFEQAKKREAALDADYRRALELLAKVVMNQWDRFSGIETIALEELNQVYALLARQLPWIPHAPPVDARLLKPLDCDVRIVMTWDADATDIDLHVVEPSAERAYYQHNRTTIGGLVSQDFTAGYGPEEYLLRKAMPGPYKIEANFYGSSAAALLGAVTVQVDVFTNFGRENQQRRSLTLRLEEKKETVQVGQIEW